jgi:hypothetical protein
MPVSVVITLLVAALITVILLPSSSATHTVPPMPLPISDEVGEATQALTTAINRITTITLQIIGCFIIISTPLRLD